MISIHTPARVAAAVCRATAAPRAAARPRARWAAVPTPQTPAHARAAAWLRLVLSQARAAAANRPPNRVYRVVEPARWEQDAGLVALEDSDGMRNALSPDWLKRL